MRESIFTMFATDPAETQDSAFTVTDLNKSPAASPTFPTVQRRPKNLSRLDIPNSLSSLGNREPSTFEPSPELAKPSDVQETVTQKPKPVDHLGTNSSSTLLFSPGKFHPGIHPPSGFESSNEFYAKGLAESNVEHSTGSTMAFHTFQSLSATPNVIVESGLLANFAKSAADSQESNTRFKNDFIEEESLGEGSFGVVTKCMNKMDKNYYAVKKMTRGFQGKGKYYSQGEMKAMALIQNTDDNVNIIRYFQSWVEGGKSYLVMEYCPSSLPQQVKETGGLNESQLKKVVRDVSLGLNFLHKNDIVHLDVKTANILISESGIYKLGDMGCAKRLNEAGVSDGDDRYLAPEALNSSKEPHDEKKFDIYSLGVMLFELATNCDLTKNGETYKNVKGGDLHQLDSVSHLSDSFKDLIRLMLDHDPKKRPTAQEILDKYVLSQEQIDLKWEKIARKALESEKADLEKQYQTLQNRRKSIS